MGKSNKDKEKNLKAYEAYLASEMPNGVSQPDHKQEIGELVAEGMKLLNADEKKSAPVEPGVIAAPAAAKKTPKNVYARAREEILKKSPAWYRSEVLRMEAAKDLDNRFYNDFVHRVALRGDELSC